MQEKKFLYLFLPRSIEHIHVMKPFAEIWCGFVCDYDLEISGMREKWQKKMVICSGKNTNNVLIKFQLFGNCSVRILCYTQHSWQILKALNISYIWAHVSEFRSVFFVRSGNKHWSVEVKKTNSTSISTNSPMADENITDIKPFRDW